jgi:hypothetical protein
MPATYTLIASNTLSSTATSVTFSAISASYTDLVLRCSIRNNDVDTWGNVRFRVNSDSATNYSSTSLSFDSGGTAGSSRGSSETSFTGVLWEGGSYTANTFTSTEIYIPSYTSTSNRPLSIISTTENNSATANVMNAVANLYRGASAITSITLDNVVMAVGSSFFLYGIKKS